MKYIDTTVESVDAVKTNPIKSYFVDCFSTTSFYTPAFTITELLSGMESDEIFTSRLAGFGFHVTIGRPYGWARKKWANLWHVGPESSKFQKFLVDTSLFLMVQPPLYAGVLHFTGTSKEETLAAIVSGTITGIATGRPFGWWQDKVRSYFGTKPALSK